MNEIKKMYENAEVKKINTHQSEIDNGDPRFTGISHSNSYIKYPPFTAEKQIAILMFILNKFGDIGFQKMYSIRGNDENTRKDFIKCLCDCEHETFDSRPVDFYYQNGASDDNLEESLAGLINSLWQDLTEEEKAEIKRILE